jgi:hypothetical protein
MSILCDNGDEEGLEWSKATNLMKVVKRAYQNRCFYFATVDHIDGNCFNNHFLNGISTLKVVNTMAKGMRDRKKVVDKKIRKVKKTRDMKKEMDETLGRFLTKVYEEKMKVYEEKMR